MVLKSLEIQGFKSFPDKTKITFDKGITAVVGPNGSGKSNISDSIRWVLGEISSKQLRGSGKMEDVIFGGTQLRGAMGFASVALTLDNSDHRLEIENDEVTVGRKYYRSGESEYTINGQAVRLKDIYELFLDTGLGRDGYSIIGQGRIAEIVGSKSSERREIFEEASGIAKYRYRKNEAERRLASSEENLLRLRDILRELEERVGPLERESKKAQSFLEYAAQRKSLEVTLWVDTVRRARETVRDQQRKMETAQADYDRDNKMLEELEEETEAVRLEGERLVLRIEEYNRDITAITEQAASYDSQIAVLKNDISHNLANIESITAEISAADKAGGEIEREIAEHNEKIAECDRLLASYERRIEQLEQLLEDITRKSQATGERRGAITVALAAMTQKLTQLKVDSAFAQSTAESAAARLIQAKTECENGEKAIAELQTEKEDTEKMLSSLNEKLTTLKNIKDGIEFKLQTRREQLEKAENEVNFADRAIESANQRIGVLKDLEKNMDGYQQSVKTVIKAGENHRLRGIIGTVASVLTVENGYETAIETALGYALQNIVVQDETAAKAAMQLLKNEKAGRATFLPLDTMRPSSLDARLTGSAKIAAQLVRYDEKYKNVVSNLLGRIVIVDDINEASLVAKQNGYRFRLVTRDGQVINAGGSFTGGSTQRSAGVFSRKQEIEELKKKAEALTIQKTEADEKRQKLKAETDKLSADYTAADSEEITYNGDRIRGEMERDRIENALSQNKAATEILAAECAELEKNIAECKAKKQNAETETEHISKEISSLEEELNGIDGNDDSFVQTRTRLSSELGEIKLQQLAAQKDADMHRQQIENLSGRGGETELRLNIQRENIERLKQLNEENDEKIKTLEAAKAENKNKIDEIEGKIQSVRTLRMEKEKSVNEKREKNKELLNHREDMSREIARLAERKAALETEYDQTIAKLWEEYELTFNDAEALCVEFDNTAELRRRVAEIRAKIKALGNVNVNAIEEYAEVGERYRFMKTQVADVEKAKDELTKLINELSAEMRDLFSESFVRINHNFSRIFTELFGGGSAQLKLSDPDDLLQSGIEIEVAPPGKIIKNLSALSGGEQALVAISIYFAILAVNPAPFCILDEIEAALDDVNVTRYAQYLRRITDNTQFIVITHRRGTMEEADVLYGVTMQEDGVSKLLKLDAANVDVHMVS